MKTTPAKKTFGPLRKGSADGTSRQLRHLQIKPGLKPATPAMSTTEKTTAKKREDDDDAKETNANKEASRAPTAAHPASVSSPAGPKPAVGSIDPTTGLTVVSEDDDGDSDTKKAARDRSH